MRLAAGGRRSPSARTRCALLVALLAVPLGPLLGPAAPATAANHLLSVELAALEPAVGQPGATLRATGRLRATGNETLRDLQVRLRLSRTRLNSRSEMAAVAQGRTSSRDGDIVASQGIPRRLEAGATVDFDVAVPLDEVPVLDEFGVHVLGLEVVGTAREGFGRLTILRTFLPWVPAERDFEPTGFAWLWPLLSAPARLPDGQYADDRLAAEIASDGRLGRLAAAGGRLGQQVPLTWVVDPALLDTVADMSEGYEVRSAAGGDATPGTGATTAAGWLEQVRSGAGLGSVVALPYGDPDLVALRRHGLTPDVVASRARGAAAAAELLDQPVVTDLAWPAQGWSDGATLRDLREFGIQSAVLDARALQPELDLPFTPSGRADVETRAGRVAAVLYDPTLTAALARGGPQPLLAAQRFLAETAMITAELPGTGPERTILIAPPRRWAPSAELLDRVVGVALQAPWMSPRSVADLRADPPPEIDRRRLRYPRAVRRAELPGPYLGAVATVHAEAARFASVLTEPASIRPALDAAVYRLQSTWWRERPERTEWLTATRNRVTDLTSQVQVLPGSYTFGSKSGTIPLTVSNDLSQAVTVDISLSASPPRLRLGAVDPVRIDAESKLQVEVPATSIANGPVLIRTVLRTPDGEPYGDPVQLRVQVTQYGTVALLITGAAAAVLFATAGFRLFRRAAAARRGSDSPAGPA